MANVLKQGANRLHRLMTLQGHSRSLIFASIESAHGTSYWSSIVTLVLSCGVSEILDPLFYIVSLFRPKFRGFSLWTTSMMLGSCRPPYAN